MKKGKKLELNHLFELIKSGLIPSEISKKLSIPKGTLSYHVAKLIKLECIENPSYGVWNVLKEYKEVRKVPKGSMKPQTSNILKKEIRGHAFIWKIEFIEPYNWKKAVKYYKKKKLSFSVICNGKVPRTIFKGRKVWLTKKGMTIYEPIDFMGGSSFSVKGTAVFEMDRLIKGLLKELNLKFRYYRFSTSREHYGMIKNELARQYNNKKEKMVIRNESGEAWLWIDDSKGLGELETKDPSISRQVQNYWNNHKKNNFEVDADYVKDGFKESAKQIKENAENMAHYGKHVVTHVKLMDRIADRMDLMDEREERLVKAIEGLSKK